MRSLPQTPVGIGWRLSWMDIEQKSTLVIELHAHDECVHRKKLAVDLYGAEGVRETGQWMLNKWLAIPKDSTVWDGEEQWL